MNYDAAIDDMRNDIKQDKSITQPWRNKAVARLDEVQAFVRMGKTSTNAEPSGHVFGAIEDQCICPGPGVRNRGCKATFHSS